MIDRRKIWVPSVHRAEVARDRFDDSLQDAHELLVQNLYSHISAGTELACIAGKESFFSIPDTPGYTSIGRVLKKGDALDHVMEGDLVYTYGPHAEYFKIDIRDRWHGLCVKLPPEIDLRLAAFTHMAGIAMTSLRSSRVELGDHVLVSGLGAIGNLAAQLVQLQGGCVIASDILEERLQIAKTCGIRDAVHSKQMDMKALVEERTGGKLVSTYIDATGLAPVVEQSLELLSLYGEVILLGSPRNPYESELTAFLQHFHNLPWCQNMKGALEFTWPTHESEFVKHSIERNARVIFELIREDRLKIAPLLSHQIAPDEIQSAYDGLRDQPEKYIGVIIDWSK